MLRPKLPRQRRTNTAHGENRMRHIKLSKYLVKSNLNRYDKKILKNEMLRLEMMANKANHRRSKIEVKLMAYSTHSNY